MSKIYIHILVFILLFSFSAQIFAQENNSVFKKYDVRDGLSLSAINCLLVDNKGFLWIGTQDGLNKYDGYNFLVYRHDPNDVNTIVANHIQAIYEDRESNIWLGTREGLDLLNRKTGNFYHFAHDGDNINSLVSNDIQAICQDMNDVMWIKTPNHLSSFDLKTGKFRAFEHYYDIFRFSSDNIFYQMIVDKKGLVWMPTKDGLFFFDPDKEQFKQFLVEDGNSSCISDNEARSIFQSTDGRIFVGTANGLNLYNRRTHDFERFYFQGKPGSGWNSINSILESTDGQMIVGTESGLAIFDQERKQLTGFVDEHKFINSLKISKIRSVVQDKSGIFWVGSAEMGLLKFDLKKKKFKLLQDNSFLKHGLASNDIGAIFLNNDNKLWLGTWSSGLSIYDRQTQTTTNYSSSDPKNHIHDDNISAIIKDSQGRIWVGTRKGPAVYNRTTEKFEDLASKAEIRNNAIFRKAVVYCIFEDKNRTMWFGTHLGLIKLIHNEAFLVKSPFSSLKRNQAVRVNKIIQDKEGYLWLGTLVGLIKFDPRTEMSVCYTKSSEKKISISNNAVWSIFEDKAGNIWIGTESGLNKYDKAKNSFEFFTQRIGFKNDLIYGIVQDKHENLWLSTNKGLVRFNPKRLEVNNYDIEDGLQNYEFNSGSYFASPSGEIFFGGISGVNYFFADSILLNSLFPRVSFTSHEVINRNGVNKTYIDELEELVIEPSDYMVTIEFASLDFSRPDRNRYKYKLIADSEAEQGWVDIGSQHYVTLSRPKPGNYTLYVKGSNSDQVWSENTLKLKITVKPSLYSSNLAFTFYGLVALIIIYGGFRIYSRNQHKTIQILKEKEKASQEVARQREELIIKNANITDSLHYAQRIIQAMLPSQKLFKRLIPDSFILYLPKDIVSGDFYWVGERNNKVFVAVVDCTGHGIPGAFMSIIGLDLIRNITKKQGIEDPAEILNRLNAGVADTFREAEGTTVSDGMDLAFCAFDLKHGTIEYAGAFNPMYIVRNNNIIEYKGDRFAVGLATEKNQQVFKSHTVKLEEGDAIYIFSDGYEDQFGGPKGKKFKSRRFRHLLMTIAHLPMDEQKKILDDTIMSWKGNYEQVDDILLVGIRYPFLKDDAMSLKYH
jgi:ligand-binding sensor domain-containing protein/serine phosphatase RsbU (regulator of sigma subunit)